MSYRGESFRLKQITLLSLLFLVSGILIELYLLGHYEDRSQLIPVLITGASLILVIVVSFRKTVFTLGLFKAALILAGLSGVYGTYLHLQANFEFEQDMTPTAGTLELLTKSLSGALPALAPGSMIVLAMIGYLYILILQNQSQ